MFEAVDTAQRLANNEPITLFQAVLRQRKTVRFVDNSCCIRYSERLLIYCYKPYSRLMGSVG